MTQLDNGDSITVTFWRHCFADGSGINMREIMKQPAYVYQFSGFKGVNIDSTRPL